MARVRNRRPLPSARPLSDLTWADVTHLVHAGHITWADVSHELARRMDERYGGRNPYADLEPLDERDVLP